MPPQFLQLKHYYWLPNLVLGKAILSFLFHNISLVVGVTGVSQRKLILSASVVKEAMHLQLCSFKAVLVQYCTFFVPQFESLIKTNENSPVAHSPSDRDVTAHKQSRKKNWRRAANSLQHDESGWKLSSVPIFMYHMTFTWQSVFSLNTALNGYEAISS